MGRRRHGLFPNAADLVHFPRKAFFNQATSVLVPCPPHWISPLWEQEYHKSRAERIPYLKHEARITEPLVSPYSWKKPVDSQRLSQSALETQLPSVDHKALPFPRLHQQDVTKANLHHKHPSASSFLAKPKSDFRSRVCTVPLSSAKKHFSLLDSKPQHKGPLDSNHKIEANSGPSYFPKIFADYDHRPEDRNRHWAQSSKFHYHKAEFPFMSNRSVSVIGTKTFPKCQAKTTQKPVKAIHSSEALPRPRIQGRGPATKYHPGGVPSSRLDYWCKATSLKTSDHWVQAKTFKVSNCKHNLKETVSLLRCIDNRSKDRSTLLINLNGRARASTACPSCPQHWSIATDLPSPGPNHQASTTLTLSRDFKPGEASLFSQEEPCPKNSSSPFPEAPLGPDYKATDTYGLPLLSESQVSLTMIPVCLDHSKAKQDSQLEATTLLFRNHQKSISVGSNVQIASLEHAPGLDAQTALSLEYHQNTEVVRSQDYLTKVLQDTTPKKPTPKGLGQLAKPLPSNGCTEELVASNPNDPQTILPTDCDNQDSSRLDQDSACILTSSNFECRTTYSPSPDDHQTKNVQDDHNQVTPQEQHNQGETKAPGADLQAVTLTDQDQEDKLSIGAEVQNKTYHPRPPTSGTEQQVMNPHRSDPQITPPASHDYKATDVPDPDALLHAELEQPETMPPEIQHQGPAPTDQAEWETSPPSITDPKNPGLSGPKHWTTPLSSSDARTIIPPRLDHQAEDTPDANAQGILQTEQECEVLPPGIKHQVMTLVDLSHKVVISLDLGFQDITLPKYQNIASLNIDQKSKDALESNAQISLQKEQDHLQAMPLGKDNRMTTIEVQDREAILSLNPECQVTLLLRTDHQEDSVSDANDKASEVRLKLSQREIPPEYYQHTSLSRQHERVAPSLLIELQEVTLSGLSSQDKLKSNPNHQSEAVPDPNTQAVPPLDPQHSGTVLMGPGEGTSSSGPRPSFIPLSSPKNETEAKLYVTNPKGTIPCLDEKETVPPSSKYKAQIPSGPKHPWEGYDPYPKAELSSRHLDEFQPRPQHQTKSKKNFIHTSWCLNYIKPYTIEGGDVPEKTVENIISSIPQDKLKNDICEKSILQKMKRGSSLSGNQDILLDYSVCLICASWIPHGCPHVWGMENPCEIKLLAIPMPLSSSEEVVNVKFVLQLNQPTKYPIFTFPYSHYNFPRHIAHPMNSPISSHSALEFPGFARRKWFGFMLGRDSQKGRTLPTKQWPYTEKMTITKDGRREETTLKEHRTFLRSLLGIFQKKQRKN